MIRVVFTRKRTLGSLLLRVFQWSEWSHCALIDERRGTIIEAAAFGGTQERHLMALLSEASASAVIDVPCRSASAVLAAARAQLGKPYDWLGVLGIGLRRRWQDADRWFCSELIAHAFEAAGEPLFRGQPWRITPRDLFIPLWQRQHDPKESPEA